MPPISHPGVFEHRIVASKDDIDSMGHVNNVVYVRWVQEVALAHWNYASDESLRAKYSWVLLRHEIDYRNPAFLMDEVAGYTWVGKCEGPKFERFVSLHLAADNKLLAESKTLWCLLDARSMKPRRIEQDITSILRMGERKI